MVLWGVLFWLWRTGGGIFELECTEGGVSGL